jgi:hypothetical protein
VRLQLLPLFALRVADVAQAAEVRRIATLENGALFVKEAPAGSGWVPKEGGIQTFQLELHQIGIRKAYGKVNAPEHPAEVLKDL